MTQRFRGAEALERLHWHLRAHCYVRRVKADVLPQLRPKRQVTIPVDLSNEIRALEDRHRVLGELARDDRAVAGLERERAEAEAAAER